LRKSKELKKEKTIRRRLVELVALVILIGIEGLGISGVLACSSDDGSSNDGETTPGKQPHAMGFAASIPERAGSAAGSRTTRTAPEPGEGELTTELLQALGFGVYCWYTGETDVAFIEKETKPVNHISTYAQTMLMQNQRVIYNSSKWTYAPTKYWPLNDNEKLTYRAYAPYVSYQLQTDATTGMPLLPVVVTKDGYHDGTQHDPLWGTSRHEGTDGEGTTYGKLYNNYTYKNSGDHYTDPVEGDAHNGTIYWYFHHGMSKLMFTCSVIQDPGCDKVVIRSIKIEDLYTQGLLALCSPTEQSKDKPYWAQKSGNMEVTLSEHDPNTEAVDLAPAPGDDTDPSYQPYPFVITTSTTKATDPADLLKHGLLIIPRDFTSEGMKVTITYSIDEDAEPLIATGTIEQDFQGNTSYTVRLSLTPSTRGLEISLVQSAFTPWKNAGTADHEVYNW
jgi:hypothetical protein